MNDGMIYDWISFMLVMSLVYGLCLMLVMMPMSMMICFYSAKYTVPR